MSETNQYVISSGWKTTLATFGFILLLVCLPTAIGSVASFMHAISVAISGGTLSTQGWNITLAVVNGICAIVTLILAIILLYIGFSKRGYDKIGKMAERRYKKFGYQPTTE